MDNIDVAELHGKFSGLITDVEAYLADAEQVIDQSTITWFDGGTNSDADRYWDHLTEEVQVRAAPLIKRLLTWSAQVAPLLKMATLSTESDQRDLSLGIKTIRAAITLRKFRHWDADYLHNEDIVLGISAARQSDNEPQSPDAARKDVAQASRTIFDVVQLLAASGDLVAGTMTAGQSDKAARYRSGTAFVMMSMDKAKPELEDVYEAVKDVFAEFDVTAVRSDDIEHEGLITERIINEIATSEFLFADLSGQRPNVYYEVGYAHALNKRVILFRKAGDSLHFDLAGYNCPQYTNNKDLKERLRKRLIEVTNREPKPSQNVVKGEAISHSRRKRSMPK